MNRRYRIVTLAAACAVGTAAASGVGAQASDVTALEQARTVQLSSASVINGSPGEAAWFASAARSVISAGRAITNAVAPVTKVISPVRLGVAAVGAANVAKKQETTARFAGVTTDADWAAAVQASQDALLAPPSK